MPDRLVTRTPAPALPFRGRPGRCPPCGESTGRVEVLPVGSWSGRDSATGRSTGGAIYGANCPACGAMLQDFHRGGWCEGDAGRAVWHCPGGRELAGGDWRRGRPGAWSPGDAVRHEARLRELLGRSGSLVEAVRVLHAAAGLGAVHLCGLVARVADLSLGEARREVVRALAPG